MTVGRLPRWSVVIPAYNEAARLPTYLKEVQAYFEGRDESYEVIVVDDGSQDGTADRVREVAAGRPGVTVHALDRNRGKGHAVRAGMARAVGELRLMADADGATPIAEVARLEAAVAAGADVAVGSRVLEDPAVVREVRVASPALRPCVQLPAPPPGGRSGAGHPVRLQALSRGGGRGAVPARHHRRLRLRRRAADAGPSAAASGSRRWRSTGPISPGPRSACCARGRACSTRCWRPAAASPGARPGGARMIARRTQEIEPFLAVEVFQRAQALERQGVDVIHLEFGEPDFDTPAVIREAAEKALKDGRTRYAHTLGILPLREAIAEHYHTRYGVTVSPDQILVTAGTSPAMLLLFSALLDPGDEVDPLRPLLRLLSEVREVLGRRCRSTCPSRSRTPSSFGRRRWRLASPRGPRACSSTRRPTRPAPC